MNRDLNNFLKVNYQFLQFTDKNLEFQFK